MPQRDQSQAVEAVALALAKRGHYYGNKEVVVTDQDRENARAAITAHLAALSEAGMVVVPREPSEAQWGGLARDIIMWMECWQDNTPRTLLKHLELSGCTIPQWLLDEPEMKRLDHAITKGTKAVIIYRAMLSASVQDTGAGVGNG